MDPAKSKVFFTFHGIGEIQRKRGVFKMARGKAWVH
jgi:hypothetical protein